MAEPFAKLDGLKHLDKALAQLGPTVGFKALRGGLMRASTPIFKRAKQNALATGVKGFDSDATAAAMGRWTKKTGKHETTLFMGPKSKAKKALALWNLRHPRKKPVKRLSYFHLVEFGSKRGPAQPFLRPALQQGAQQFLTVFGTELGKAIEREARKVASAQRPV